MVRGRHSFKLPHRMSLRYFHLLILWLLLLGSSYGMGTEATLALYLPCPTAELAAAPAPDHGPALSPQPGFGSSAAHVSSRAEPGTPAAKPNSALRSSGHQVPVADLLIGGFSRYNFPHRSSPAPIYLRVQCLRL